MKTNNNISYFIFFSFILLFFISQSINFVNAQELTGIGISPSCFPSPNINGECNESYDITQHITNLGDNITTKFRIYNFDDSNRDFIIKIEPQDCIFNNEGLKKINSLVNPKEFSLKKHDAGSCIESQGCKEIEVMVPYNSIKQGRCVLNVLAIFQREDPTTMLKINQIVGAKITIQKKDDFLIRNWIKIIIVIIIILLLLILIILKKTFKQKNIKKQKT